MFTHDGGVWGGTSETGLLQWWSFAGSFIWSNLFWSLELTFFDAQAGPLNTRKVSSLAPGVVGKLY